MEKEKSKKESYVIDAKGKVLGRLSSQIALILQGKSTPDYMPNKDKEVFVVVKNVDKIKLTGKKGKRNLFSPFRLFRRRKECFH